MNQDNGKSSLGNISTSTSDQPKPCDSFKKNEIPSTSNVSSSLSYQASNIETIAAGYRASLSGNSTNFIPEQPTTNPGYTESEFISASELLSFSPYFGNTPTSLPEQLTGGKSFVEDQSASPTDTSISTFQHTRNTPNNAYCYTPVFCESTLASITKHPAHTECSVEDESTITPYESIFQFQQTNDSYYTNFSSGDAPTYVLEQQPTNNVRFLQDRYASASGVSASLSQQRLDFQNIVPENTISFSGNSSVSVTEHPTSNFQPAIDNEYNFSATRQVSNLHFQQAGDSPTIEGISDACRRFPITFNLLKKQNLRTPAPGEQVTAKCPNHMTETSSSRKQATAKSLKQKGVISSKKLSHSKGLVAAERPKQKKGSPSSDKTISPSKMQAAAVSSRKKKDAISLFELTSPSKELATGINQIQMIGSFSSCFEQTSSSEKQETSVHQEQMKGEPLSSIGTPSLSNKQETALHLRQKTGKLTSVETMPSLKNKPTAATSRYRTRSQSLFSSKEHPQQRYS